MTQKSTPDFSIKALHTYFRTEFEQEVASDFRRLSRIPDTWTRIFLEYYKSLNASDQDALADASTLWGALRIVHNKEEHHGLSLKNNAAWKKWGERLIEPWRYTSKQYYEYLPVPVLRTAIAQAKIDRAKGKQDQDSKECENYALSIRSIKAPDLRKHVKNILKPLLGNSPKNVGGCWECEGNLYGSNVLVEMDYGSGSAQLRYQVNVHCPNPNIAIDRLCFEACLGAGHGGWNFITEENLSDAMSVFSECIEYAATLPQRIYAVAAR